MRAFGETLPPRLKSNPTSAEREREKEREREEDNG